MKRFLALLLSSLIALPASADWPDANVLPAGPTGGLAEGVTWCPGTVQTLHAPVLASGSTGQAGAWACLISSSTGAKEIINILVGYDRDLTPNVGIEREVDNALQAAWDFCNGDPSTTGLDVNQEYKCQINVASGAYILGPSVFFQNSFTRAVAHTTIIGYGASLTPTTRSANGSGYQSDGAISGLPGTWTRGMWWSLTDAVDPDDISTGGETIDTIATIVPDAGTCSQQFGTPTVRVDTSAAHGLLDGSTTQREGDMIEITGTTNYNAIEYVRQVIDADTFCYIKKSGASPGSESAGSVRPMRNAAFAVGPNTTANSRVPGGPAAIVIGGGTAATANVTVAGFTCVFGTTVDTPNGDLPYRKRCVLVTGAGLGVSNIKVAMIGCSQSEELGQTCVEVDSLGGSSLVQNVEIANLNYDFAPNFGPDPIKIGYARAVNIHDVTLGHGGGITVGKDATSTGNADPQQVTLTNVQFAGCGVSCFKFVSGQITVVSAWMSSDVDGPGSAGSRKVDPGFLGWVGGSAAGNDTDFACLSCEIFLQNESNLTGPYVKFGNARSIVWNYGDISPGNDANAVMFGNPGTALTVSRLSLSGPPIRGGTTPVLIDTTNLTITKWDQLRTLDIEIDAIVAADDRLFHKLPAQGTLRQLDCVAQAGTSLTTVDVTVQECNSSGAGCASSGLSATMTAVDTNVSDAVATDALVDAADWLKYVTGTVTWTTPGDVSCTLQYLVN